MRTLYSTSFLSLFLQAGLLISLPTSPEIIEGCAAFFSAEKDLRIEVHDQSQLSWGDFSIAADETVFFQQPSIDSLVINRVRESNPSHIFGRLESNGKLVLLNPHGIFVGKEGVIRAESFIAATLDLHERTQNKFVLGQNRGGEIHLAGRVEAKNGSVVLISDHIHHSGKMDAQGSVAFMSTEAFSRGAPVLDDLNAFAYLGERRQENSMIELPGGEIQSKGDVFLYATLIGLTENSIIDVSRESLAGNIEVGYPGVLGNLDPHLSAKRIYFDPSSSIFANGEGCGKGGNVHFCASEAIFFEGLVTGKGGNEGGDGGYLKLTAPYFEFLGTPDLSASQGKGGLLHLDPTDILITTFASSTTVGIGALVTWTGAALPSNPVQVNNLALQAVLVGGTSVLVDTGANFDFGFPGDIRVGTLAAGTCSQILWASAAVLELRANRDIFIEANIQNSGTGDVILTAGRNVTIVPSTLFCQPPISDALRTSVGSRAGLTHINAGGDVHVFGDNGAIFGTAHVGYFPNPAIGSTVCTGPILIECANLTIESGPGAANASYGCDIGHGFPVNYGSISDVMSTTASATITINARGNITMLSQPFTGGDWQVKIGHGSGAITGPIVGDITVTGGGNLRMISQGNVPLLIGHGGSALTGLSGNIRVLMPSNAPNGSITMSAVDGSNSTSRIGHVANTTAPMTADIEVCCRNDLTMTSITTVSSRGIQIGHSIGVPAGYTGQTLVTVGNDLLINNPPASSGVYAIGSTFSLTAAVVDKTQVVVGRDFIANFVPLTGSLLIGNAPNIGSNTEVFLAAGRDILLTGAFIQSAPTRTLAIAAGRNFIATAQGGQIYITTQNGLPVQTTCIHTGGDLIARNGIAGPVTLGNSAQANFNVDFRAGGDIQLSSNISGAGTGFIFIEADTLLPAGSLWNYSGGTLNSICGFACPGVPLGCLPDIAGTAVAAPSPPITPNGVGCFSTDRAPLPLAPLTLGTTSGDITLHSAPRSTRMAGNCNLDIGNNVLLTTISGDLEVYGSAVTPCTRSSFYDVTITQPIVTTGTVLIVANHDLTITSTGFINTSGGNSPVTLVCDNEFPIPFLLDSGHFVMQAGSFITTGTGPLHIYTVQPNLNTINGTLNGQTFPPPGGAANFFDDTCYEQWCTYYCAFIPGTCAMPTTPPDTPFTIAYKICESIFNGPDAQPLKIISQLSVDLHPYNEFPGWMSRFFVYYSPNLDADQVENPDEPYLIRRRNLNLLKHPKTYTVPLNDELDHERP